MSASSAEDEKKGAENLPVPYGVGYGRPPTEHRFQKGHSGNPKGRPKTARKKPSQLDPGLQPTDNLVLEEAYRLVTIREGEKVIELPAIQAAVRSLAISAMKGSRLSQRALADLVRQVEDRKASERLTAMENAFEYKQGWSAELERRRKYGLDEPDPIPHPDDIFIDMRTGHVRTDGPLDEAEKADWDRRLERRAEAQREVTYYAQKCRRVRSARVKEFCFSTWIAEQFIFDLINDAMPTRYKAKLENRSYAEGASTAGKALEQYRKLR